MTRAPEMSNRYLLTAFARGRGRWITDTTGHLQLARMWAEDWLRAPDRYSHVMLTDMATREDLVVTFGDGLLDDGFPAGIERIASIRVEGGIHLLLFPDKQQAAALGWRADGLSAKQWVRICRGMGELGIEIERTPEGMRAHQWLLVDDPNIPAQPMPRFQPVDPETAREDLARLREAMAGDNKLGSVWHLQDPSTLQDKLRAFWDMQPGNDSVRSAPVPYPASFKLVKFPSIGILVADPGKGEVMVPGQRCQNLSMVVRYHVENGLRNLLTQLFGEPMVLVDDIALTPGETA